MARKKKSQKETQKDGHIKAAFMLLPEHKVMLYELKCLFMHTDFTIDLSGLVRRAISELYEREMNKKEGDE